DLLNRLPTSLVAEFVADHFIPVGDGRAAWLAHARTVERFTWSTQRQVGEHGRLDILLEGDAQPLLVVESKVRAGLQHRLAPDHDQGTGAGLEEVRHQLHDYGRWLSRQMTDASWGGALALLTHATPVPPDFGRSNPAYRVPWQRACRWHQLWRWLRHSGRQRTQATSKVEAWQELAAELAEFLEENEMASETMTQKDLAVLQVYAGSAERVEETFRRIRQRIKKFLTDVSTNRPERWFDRGGCFYYVYLNSPPAPPRTKWYAAWGFRFPSDDQWWEATVNRLPSVPFAVVFLEGERDPYPAVENVTGDRLPKGWIGSPSTEDAVVIAVRPLHDFPGDSERFADELAEWVA